MSIGHKIIGSGPQHVLVLHGWFGDENFLDAMLPALDLAGRTYVCIAYRGYGASKHLTGSFTLDEIASDALDLVAALGWTQFHIIGHSMGAKAAQKVMLRAPNQVKSIIALTPVPASSVPFDEAGWSLFSGAVDDLGKRQDIIDFSTGGRLTATWVRGLAERSAASSTPEAFSAYLRAWANSDFSEEVKGSPTSLVALVGQHDPHLNLAVMQATFGEWFPNFNAVEIANAGHYPMDEAPIALARAIEYALQCAV